jgi:hypothetical protein
MLNLYPELKEPVMSIAEIVALLMSFSDEELVTLDDDKFASALITLHNWLTSCLSLTLQHFLTSTLQSLKHKVRLASHG